MLGIDKERIFKSVNIAIVTISDTRTFDEDKSGATLEKRIIDSGHNIGGRFLVKDDVIEIKGMLNDLILNKDIDVIITTGGTGITGRDLTPEVFKEILEKEIPGFG
ncbi:MAG: molybdenum cofactor biosynthesis protein, partial [Pelagibacterales bacterium]|nr:molybdenum cofactor biosynthesis protein [Pelagibacterales bacterium]